eukprot:gene8334-9231_t
MASNSSGGSKTLKVQHNGLKLTYMCNHKEANTYLALHASLEESYVVIVSKDTDVLVLLVWTYSICSPGKKWLSQPYNQEKYTDIETTYGGDMEVSTKEAMETTDVTDIDTNSKWEMSDFSLSEEVTDEWLR